MADLAAYESALAHAGLLWPKTRSAPRAQSAGLPCSVHQLERSRGAWTLMTPWEELLESAVVWRQVRLFTEIDLAWTEHGRQTEDVVVLRQHATDVFTFRPSDLHASTLSFVWAPDGGQVFPCMLFDVLPRLADAHAVAFSYLIMFEHEGHARLVQNLLQRSWCRPRAGLSGAPAGAGSAGAPAGRSDEGFAGFADEDLAAGFSDGAFALDTGGDPWERSLVWDEPA